MVVQCIVQYDDTVEKSLVHNAKEFNECHCIIFVGEPCEQSSVTYIDSTEHADPFSVRFLDNNGITILRRVPCPDPGAMLVEVALVNEDNGSSILHETLEFFKFHLLRSVTPSSV